MLGNYRLVGLKSFAKPTAFNGPHPSGSWSTEPHQTVSCSFSVVKLPRRTGMHIGSVVVLAFIPVVLVQLMFQLLRKPKIPKAFLYQLQHQGTSFSLWWQWLVLMRILACLPLNSCGLQGRKSVKQVSEVLLYQMPLLYGGERLFCFNWSNAVPSQKAG